MMSEANIRGMAGELRDLKHRYPGLVTALGGSVALIDELLAIARAKDAIGPVNGQRYARKRNNIVRTVASRLNTTPEELAGGLLPEED